MEEFEVGAIVEWTSQAAGSPKTKVGEIVAVVKAKHSPNRIVRNCPDLNKLTFHWGGGMDRDHESYLVRVDHGPKRLASLYWPRVCWLKVVDPKRKTSGAKK